MIYCFIAVVLYADNAEIRMFFVNENLPTVKHNILFEPLLPQIHQINILCGVPGTMHKTHFPIA
jgi:hypothetical protein